MVVLNNGPKNGDRLLKSFIFKPWRCGKCKRFVGTNIHFCKSCEKKKEKN